MMVGRGIYSIYSRTRYLIFYPVLRSTTILSEKNSSMVLQNGQRFYLELFAI